MRVKKEVVLGSLRMEQENDFITCRIRKSTKAQVLKLGSGAWGESFADVLERVVGGKNA